MHIIWGKTWFTAGARLEIMNKPDMYEIDKPINCTANKNPTAHDIN